MRTNRLISPLLILMLAVGFVMPLAAGEAKITVVTDRADALYSVGDAVSFEVAVQEDGKAVTSGEVAYVLSEDGWTMKGEGTIALTESPATIPGSLDHPGFLRCVVTYTDAAGKTLSATAAAGFDPLHIQPSMPVPEDFDAFWDAQKELLAQVPMHPQWTPVDAKADGIEAFDIKLGCLGATPVSGYYVRPAGAAPKSLPAVLWVHGAGVGSSSLRSNIAAEGMIILDINAHGILNGQPKAYYDGLNTGRLQGYRTVVPRNRETYYFLGMYLRLIRALDFLTAQPEWDGQVLITRGSSQGGGQSLVAAGLDPRVTLLIANVPAMCDHTGRINGWPRCVPRDANGNPDPVAQEAARYFDAMNFATRTKADALLSVGFIDTTCRPTTVYAAYNNLPNAKQMLNKPLMKHAFPTEWNDLALATMLQHIKAVKGE